MNWFKCKLDLCDKAELEATGKFRKEREVKLCIDLEHVIAFREAPKDEDDENDMEGTVVYLRSGENFTINMPFKDFEALVQ